MDLGEGLASDSKQSLGRKYYGNMEYWAPEIIKDHQYSFASDIYSVGRLIAEMVQVRWNIVLKQTRQADRSVPRDIAGVIDRCTARDPAARPSANDLLMDVQDEHMKHLVKSPDGDYQMVFDDMIDGVDNTTEEGDSVNIVVESRSGQEGMELDEDGIPV